MENFEKKVSTTIQSHDITTSKEFCTMICFLYCHSSNDDKLNFFEWNDAFLTDGSDFYEVLAKVIHQSIFLILYYKSHILSI